LPTVKQLIEECGVTQKDVFVTDRLHMTREHSIAVHDRCWYHIDMDTDKRGKDVCPFLIWDFNTSAKHLTENYERHVRFWSLVSDWAAADPAQKSQYVPRITELLHSDTPIDTTGVWYKSSRLKVIRYRDEETKVYHLLDERLLPVDDESDVSWCPGFMPGKAVVRLGVISSKRNSEMWAIEGEWPVDAMEDFWAKAIAGLLRRIHGDVSQAWINVVLASTGGHYRMYYAGLRARHDIKIHTLLGP
jgi:hypothetical protein